MSEDYTDVELDAKNDRKGNFMYGAKCSREQMRDWIGMPPMTPPSPPPPPPPQKLPAPTPQKKKKNKKKIYI